MISYFLVFSLFNLWLCWNLYRPIYRPTSMLVLSGIFALLLSEIAIYVVLAEMLLFIFVFAWLDLSGFVDFVALTLLCVAWGGMLFHYYRGAEVGPLMEAALQQELGADYFSRIDRGLAGRISVPPDFRRLFRPFLFGFPEVVRDKDKTFYSTEEYSLALDVYHHQGKPENAPVLMYIHGGGWLTGSKEQQGLPLMNHLAARGWVCVSVNYRLSPKYAFPAHLIDCKRGLVWVKEHIASYGGNPDFVSVCGGSTGGNLAALIALTQNRSQLQPGFESMDTAVKACVSMYGVHDFSNELKLSHVNLVGGIGPKIMHATIEEDADLYKLASPVAQMHSNAPPFLVVHGSVDNITSCSEAERFSELLREMSEQPVVFARLPLAHHAFDLYWSLRTLQAVQSIERFLTYLHSDYLEKTKL